MITFPHMGYLHIPLQALFQELGVESCPPPPSTEKTLNIGQSLSPASACLPLKIQLGNFVEALHEGAHTLIMLGGGGPCRLGLFALLEELILKEKGYDFTMLVLEPSFPALYGVLKRICSPLSLSSLIRALYFGYRKLVVLEYILERLNQARPYLQDISSWKEMFLKQLEDSHTDGSLQGILQQLEDLPHSKEGLHIGIIGDIFTILDPFANMDLEKELGDLGAIPHPSIQVSDWIREHLFLRPLGLFLKRPLEAAARPYLKYPVGGLGQEGIGRLVSYARKGFAGAIQVFPLGCMPEIVVQGILPQVSRDLNFPVLPIIFDDTRSPVGLRTRLEAFVNLLERRGGERIGEGFVSRGGSGGD